MARPARPPRHPGGAGVTLWAVAGLDYLAAGWWLLAHPAAIGGDDALFFSRALTRFSVLDFSPQFPGYPGFVALGRLTGLVIADPVAALGLTTVMIALLLPPLSAVVAGQVGGGRAALAAFLLALTQPLLPDLGLNLLSDGSALLFFLLFLALLPPAVAGRERADSQPGRRRAFAAGLMLGLAGACRPSDAALLAGALAGLALNRRRLVLPVIAGMIITGGLALTVMIAREGLLYLTEGLRFLDGHSTGWGNTLLSRPADQPGWQRRLIEAPGLGIVLVLFLSSGLITVTRYRTPALTAAFGAMVVHGLFILVLQNPDHLRHLAPVIVLGAVLTALAPRPLMVSGLAATSLTLALTVDPRPDQPPPLAEVAARLTSLPPGSAVAAREGVFALRALAPMVTIYDRHYPADADLGLKLASGAALTLTTTRPSDANYDPMIESFPGRMLGEESLWLVPER